MLIEYMEAKVKGDPEIDKAQQALIAESGVTPAALELGLILLQHAQAQADPKARKSLLTRRRRLSWRSAKLPATAKNTSSAWRRCTTGRESTLRAAKSSIEATQGPATGARICCSKSPGCSAASAANPKHACWPKRDTAKRHPATIKSGCAVLRGLLGDDLEDRILWLSGATPTTRTPRRSSPRTWPTRH